MTVTISRLYDDRTTASEAVRALQDAGVPAGDISVVSSNADNWYSSTADRDRPARTIDRDRDGVDDRAEGAAGGAGIGAGVGGALGLLAGLGLLAIPGVGPVVAAGWLISTAAGAAAGAAAGGLIGALTQAGVSESDAHVYAEGVRRGGTLVTARVPDADRARFEAMLDRSAVDIRQREGAYREAGWSRFDETSPPYAPDQVRQERQRYTSPASTAAPGQRVGSGRR
jgi:hypothetical protein